MSHLAKRAVFSPALIMRWVVVFVSLVRQRWTCSCRGILTTLLNRDNFENLWHGELAMYLEVY